MENSDGQNKKPLISVIVPVFRVERYLEKSISSILAQSYRNLEVILVDDGSDDNCPAICDKFQALDSRIKVIHKENEGLSQARNIGLRHATGDYIGFVDSDDWIELNMYEVLMSLLQKTGADIAICNRQVESGDSKDTPRDVDYSTIMQYTNEEALRLLVSSEGIIGNAVWDKLYRRDVLSNFKFPKGRIYEDVLWTCWVLGNARLISAIDVPLYHYFKRTDSLSRDDKHSVARAMDKIEMLQRRLVYIRENYPSLEQLAVMKLQISCCKEYINISQNKKQFDADGEIRRGLYRQFCQAGPIRIRGTDGLTMKLGLLLFKICPGFLVMVFSICHTSRKR